MKKLMIAGIRFYRKHLSKYKLPTQHCIYTPTCSEYGLEAIEKYGGSQRRAFNNLENTQM